MVNLPGSRRAAVENLEAVLPALAHAVKMLRGDTAHPDDDRRRHLLPVAEGRHGSGPC